MEQKGYQKAAAPLCTVAAHGVSAQREAPAEVEQRMLRCFHGHLKLSEKVVSVRRLSFATISSGRLDG